MRWSCMCGRSFNKSKMCLACGDRLPHLVEEGEITWERRRELSRGEYREFLDELEAKNDLKVTLAVASLKNILGEMEEAV